MMARGNPVSRRRFLQHVGVGASALAAASGIPLAGASKALTAGASVDGSSANSVTSVHSLAGVQIGATQAEVTAVLGTPAAQSVVTGMGTPEWDFGNVVVGFWYPDGPGPLEVHHVAATSGAATDQGVACGDPSSRIQAVYASLVTTYGANRWAVMVDPSTELDAYVEDGFVSSLTLFTRSCPSCSMSAALAAGPGTNKSAFVASKPTS